MTVSNRFRDAFAHYIPPWLSDRSRTAEKLSAGYRYLWTMISALDAAQEVLVQGIQAAWPGIGTPTALPFIGRSRGIIRGQDDTDDDYATTLKAWLDTWRNAGSQLALAQQIHRYMSGHPMVRVVNRAGTWTSVLADGTVEVVFGVDFNWDSVSNPERSTHWWDQWVIVYDPPWTFTGAYGSGRRYGDLPQGLGHSVNRQEWDALRSLITQWKSAHTLIRAVIWCNDDSQFDPAVPASLPNGNWGQWSTPGSDPRVASDRDLTTCRFWEPWGL